MLGRMRRLALVLLTALACAPAAAAGPTPYAIGRATCDGLPRLPIETAKGMCAGLVAGPPAGAFSKRLMKAPRTLLPLDDGRSWLVADLGGWTPGRGAIWRLTPRRGAPPQLERLLDRLVLPHGMATGPDGRVYVGEMSRIVAFDPRAANPALAVQTVVSGLPDNRLHANRHPLSAFLFDRDGSLLVNVGAPSDQCLDPQGRPRGTDRCLETEGDEPLAGVRRYPYLGGGRWSAKYTMLARGLRNSLAMVRHDSGTLLQAENSIDYPDADAPYEEVNVLVAGRHYGWPYCYEYAETAPGWVERKAMDCKGRRHTAPAALLPPHAAPLAMTYYRGSMFPQLQGRLLMTWHGPREAGARLVALEVDAQGVPVARPRARYPAYAVGKVRQIPYLRGPGVEPIVLTPGWRALAGRRPTRAPVGVTVAPDGSIWVAEDHNGTVIRFAVDRP
jgi:glucose/arabinose dehydrogenase